MKNYNSLKFLFKKRPVTIAVFKAIKLLRKSG